MEEINQKVPNISNAVLLHICRHFKSLTSEDVSKLLALGFKESEIEQELKLVGSKFFSPPFSGIYALVDFIEKNWEKKEVISLENDTLVCRWVWEKSEYPNGIGNDGLVSLKSLNENELSKVYKKERKKFIVNAYPTSQIFPTFEFNVISKVKPIYEILTIYPGTYAPPFPSEEMEKGLYSFCDDFWKNHALLDSI